MADWNRIKTEYITTDTSYRRLAEKYGVHYKTIADRAKAEGWLEMRSQQAHRTLTKTLTAVSSSQAARTAKLIGVSDRLLDKVERMLEEEDDIGATALRSLAGVLRDIRDIQMIRSEADMREQEARIEKLRREASRDEEDGSKTVVVNIGGDSAWQK